MEKYTIILMVLMLNAAGKQLVIGFYNNDMNDEGLLSVYYDTDSARPFRITSIRNSLALSAWNPFAAPVLSAPVEQEAQLDDDGGIGDESEDAAAPPPPATKSRAAERRVGYRSNGCTCQGLVCGCCVGMRLQQFQFNREGCMNFTYDPMEFSIAMDMYMNDNNIFSNHISAKNPPPVCIPIPIPYLPTVDFCARIFDIHTPGQNLQMCLDFETRIQQAPVLVLHFDCMRIGSDGLAHVKPGAPLPVSSGGPPLLALPIGTTTTTAGALVTDIDTYDEVTEIKYLAGVRRKINQKPHSKRN